MEFAEDVTFVRIRFGDAVTGDLWAAMTVQQSVGVSLGAGFGDGAAAVENYRATP